MDKFQERLEQIPTEKIKSRLDKFLCLDFENMSEAEIRAEYCKTLSFSQAGCFLIPKLLCSQKTKLYRVVNFFNKDSEKTFEEKDFFYRNIQSVSYFWEPPLEKCLTGRINIENEQVLYTSENYTTCIKECDIKRDDLFFIIVYEVIKDFEYVPVGLKPKYNDSRNHKNNDLILDFQSRILRKNLTSDNKNYLYKLTHSIARTMELFPIVPIAYPSSKDIRFYNFCFTKKQAHDYLKVYGVWVCKYKSNVKNFYIGGFYKGDGDENSKPKFYECGSEEQRLYFPEIKLKTEFRK